MFDQSARERLAGAVDTRTEPRDDSLVGVLFEADKILWGSQLTLGLDPGDFWSVRPLHELAAAQGIEPVDDIAALRDEDASPEEIDRLMAALGGA